MRYLSRLGLLFATLVMTVPAAAEGINFSGKMAPDFRIDDVSFGKETSLSDFEGKVVLLEFWFLN